MSGSRWIVGLAALLVLVSVAQVNADITTNLIGYWPFDGDGQDLSGGSYDLTLYGGVGFGTGLFGQALSLPNSTSYYAARSTDDSIYDFGSSDFTVQTWVNFTSVSGSQVLVEKFTDDAGPGWTLTKTPGNAWHFYYQSGTGEMTSAAQTIDTGEWHQVVIRRDGTDFDLFYDNSIVVSGTNSGAVPDSANPLLIGKRNAGDTRGFPVNGLIDEVAIWNRALEDSEVAYLWNDGNGGQPIVPEPSTFVVLGGLLGMGLLGRLWRRRKRAT